MHIPNKKILSFLLACSLFSAVPLGNYSRAAETTETAKDQSLDTTSAYQNLINTMKSATNSSLILLMRSAPNQEGSFIETSQGAMFQLTSGDYLKNGWAKIKNQIYYFDKNGYRINDVTNIYKSGYTVEVDRINGVMTIYADANRTIPVKTIRVSVGNPGTDTPTGRYKLTRYSRWQALMGPSWGQYGTHVDGAGQGGIFVHSIACGSANSYNLPVSAYLKLGSPASHGCIRTCVADAKWVYENCNGSTIYIFDGTYKSDEVFKGPLGRRAITPLKGIKNGGYYDPTDPAA